jgi:hypothetical protein
MEVLIIVGVVLLLIGLIRLFKIIKLGNMTLITGGIKTGKSTLSVYLALRKLRSQRIKYHIKKFFIKVFKKIKIKKFVKMSLPERPLLYSNIPLNCEYVPLTKKLLLRQERFCYGSVVYICEASLIADSMSFKDAEVNENLLLLNKLFAHETKGGYLFYDTQSISDNHYAIKRCLSSYVHVHHSTKIPFFILMWVRELKFSEDNNNINVYKDDVEDNLKLIVVPKRVWKKFDCYAFSSLTDDLPVNDKSQIPVSLKVDDIVSFKEWKNSNMSKRSKEQ